MNSDHPLSSGFVSYYSRLNCFPFWTWFKYKLPSDVVGPGNRKSRIQIANKYWTNLSISSGQKTEASREWGRFQIYQYRMCNSERLLRWKNPFKGSLPVLKFQDFKLRYPGSRTCEQNPDSGQDRDRKNPVRQTSGNIFYKIPDRIQTPDRSDKKTRTTRSRVFKMRSSEECD